MSCPIGYLQLSALFRSEEEKRKTSKERMRKLRELRRTRKVVRVEVYVPEDKKLEVIEYAKKLNGVAE